MVTMGNPLSFGQHSAALPTGGLEEARLEQAKAVSPSRTRSQCSSGSIPEGGVGPAVSPLLAHPEGVACTPEGCGGPGLAARTGGLRPRVASPKGANGVLAAFG